MAKKKKKDLWVIEFDDIDPRGEGTLAYESRAEAEKAAADFIRDTAKSELKNIGWEEDHPAPKMLTEILRYLDEGKIRDAIVGWLDYQQEYTPEEKISIGPSGLVSALPWEYPRGNV
jgi:hypothetical protein